MPKRNPESELVVTLMAGRLESRDYILTLRGVTREGTAEDVADYYFKIVKKR
jgi:hypothetical protein